MKRLGLGLTFDLCSSLPTAEVLPQRAPLRAGEESGAGRPLPDGGCLGVGLVNRPGLTEVLGAIKDLL